MRGRGLGVLLDDLPQGRPPLARLPAALLGVLVLVLCLVTLLGWPSGRILTLAEVAFVLCVAAAWAAHRAPRWRGWPAVAAVTALVFLALPPAVVLLMDATPVEALDGTLLEGDSGGTTTAVMLLVTQVLALCVVTFVVYWDVISLARWLVREITRSVTSAGTALTRVVPLLMIALLLAFFTAELWQSIGRMGDLAFGGVLALFVALTLAFLARREHFDVDGAARFATRAQLAEALAPTPAAGAAGHLDAPAECPLTPRMERGLLMAASTSRLVLAALIGVCVFAFFLAVGWLTVDAATVKAWSGAPARRLLTFDGAGGHIYVLSIEHLRVAGFLAAFSGFYYAVASATDGTMRQGLRDTADDSIRSAVALRLALLARIGLAPAHGAAGDSVDQGDPPSPAEPPPWAP